MCIIPKLNTRQLVTDATITKILYMNDKPTVYIVLFRGVGGATQLPTKPLREALGAAEFKNVATYINSGNAIVATQCSATETIKTIATIVKQNFDFEKDILLMSRAEWSKVIRDNPFPEAIEKPTTLHAFVLSDKPEKQAIALLTEYLVGNERIVVKGRVLYFHTPDGFGVSKLPRVVDRVLKVVSTARNWNTVRKLMEMADAAAVT